MRYASLLAVAILAGCERAPAAAPSSEVKALRVASLPSQPDDPAWDRAPAHAAALMKQELVEPRKLRPSATEVRVQALTDGTTVAFRLLWTDAKAEDLRMPASFGDACAVQTPASAAPDLPAPQMGERGKKVEISYWSASGPAWEEGRSDEVRTFHPNAQIDHYPFTAAPLEKDPEAQARMAKLYAPAHAVGNMARRAVQDLVAEGPGTIAPAADQVSRGRGSRDAQGWRVVIARPLPKGLGPDGRSQVAFAVWNGSEEDAGSRKMHTGWIPFVVRTEGGAP